MKLFIVLTIVLAVGLAQYDGPPVAKCPPGEHSVLYCPRMAEPSCDNPTVHELEVNRACDIPDCFCNQPNVRNMNTGECVKLADCKK